jgi:hypothetical protein
MNVLTHKLLNFADFKMVGLVAVVAALGVGAITLSNHMASPESVTKQLSTKGYSDIKVGDRYWWCMKHEVGRNFLAQNAKHEFVEGHTCVNTFYSRESTEVIPEATFKKLKM